MTRISAGFRYAFCVVAALGLLSAPRADAACTFGSSGEPGLQDVLNGLFGAANAPSATADCIPEPNDALWHTVDSVGSATILVEIAGNASGNTLGIYDSSSVGTTLQLFSGPAGSGSFAYITVSGTPGAYQVLVDSFDQAGNHNRQMATFGSTVFGFFLTQPASAGGNTFFSDSARNGGNDYMYAYQGNGAVFQAGPYTPPFGVVGTNFRSTDAIMAWEDLVTSGSDHDYQDMVVLLRDITPANVPAVPLPAAAWLLLSGVLGVTPALRRRRSSQAART